MKVPASGLSKTTVDTSRQKAAVTMSKDKGVMDASKAAVDMFKATVDVALDAGFPHFLENLER